MLFSLVVQWHNTVPLPAQDLKDFPLLFGSQPLSILPPLS